MDDSRNIASPPSTAAILLIGDELLSGKVRDENATYLIGRLRALGVEVKRVVMIPDDRDLIAEEVQTLSLRFDHLFTSGGVGPTHDDITLEAIAHSFNVGLYEDPQLATIIKERFGDRLTDAHLRMARIPIGSTLLWKPKSPWPVYSYANVYILPGIPQIFKAKFELICEQFRSGTFSLRALYLNADEGLIASTLALVERDFGVSIGSYPRIDRGAPYRIRVTVESREALDVNHAVDALLNALELILSNTSTYDRSWLVEVDDPLEV
jgi:molybdenum cofactor synthesis domain-containing protein